MHCSEPHCGGSWRLSPDMTHRKPESSVLRTGLLLITLTGAALAQAAFDWNIPKPFPRPPVPAGNPMTAEKVELGRRLFYDQRMSVNGRQSCASCHKQELAFNNPNKASDVQGFSLTESEKKDLIAFLESLTDKEFLREPRFSDPWKP